MAIITSRETVQLPNGVTLKSGVPTDVPDWPGMAQNPIMQAWVKAKVLTVDAPALVPVKPVQNVDATEEKDQLIAELETLGVYRDRRSSVEALRDALAEAKVPEPEADEDAI